MFLKFLDSISFSVRFWIKKPIETAECGEIHVGT